MKGIFTISLDFELYWGVRDHRTLDHYGQNIRKVHEVVPRLLDLFKDYGIHCTWATVGFLFSENKEELENNLPMEKPNYRNQAYDPYVYIKNNELDPVFHFAPELIRKISTTPGQELATHTYSHFYTLEKNTTPGQFREDLSMAILVAKKKNIELSGIVFPRNQYSDEHISICKELGLRTYRGNPGAEAYHPVSRKNESLLRRAYRFADSYLNLAGQHGHSLPGTADIINVPASMFLRPYKKSLCWLDGIRFRRIRHCIEHAAASGKIFHLWWHPHNFGKWGDENFRFLEKILKVYRQLNEMQKMESLNMKEIYFLTRTA